MHTSLGAVDIEHCGQTSRRHSAQTRRNDIVTAWLQTAQRVDDSEAGRPAAEAAADEGGAGGRG